MGLPGLETRGTKNKNLGGPFLHSQGLAHLMPLPLVGPFPRFPAAALGGGGPPSVLSLHPVLRGSPFLAGPGPAVPHTWRGAAAGLPY